MTDQTISKICSVEACVGKVYLKGQCRPHYRKELAILNRDTGRRCSVEGCERISYALTRCMYHYQKAVKGSISESLSKCNKESLAKRFWNKVDKRPGQGPHGDCWQWTGSCNNLGYGKLRAHFHPRSAHVVSLYLYTGVEPTKSVLHSCDNPPCVNPEHLREGTQQDNVQDAVERGRVPKGRNHHAAKLNEADAVAIRELQWVLTPSQLAERFRVSPATIYDCVARRTWRHV